MKDKQALRARMRKARREYVAALPAATRALLFLRPPAPVAALAPEGSTVGLYHATASEAPTLSYARWFFENGRRLALPWFAERGAPMQFREWANPFDESLLERGPYGAVQPLATAAASVPAAAFVPLLAFTADGHRLGQGGGHYDRWLGAHPDVVPLGLAWDCQHVDSLPLEPHDRQLRAVITPTRFHEPADMTGGNR